MILFGFGPMIINSSIRLLLGRQLALRHKFFQRLFDFGNAGVHLRLQQPPLRNPFDRVFGRRMLNHIAQDDCFNLQMTFPASLDAWACVDS